MPDSGDILVHRRVPANASDYEVAFYDWCMAQARALRTRVGTDDSIDWENIAEEIEGLARSDRKACHNLTIRILEHLLKIQFLDRPHEVDHHADEIRAFRYRLERSLSPTLRKSMRDLYDVDYLTALELVRVMARKAGLRADLPSDCPYTWEDVIGREDGEWVPEPQRGAD